MTSVNELASSMGNQTPHALYRQPIYLLEAEGLCIERLVSIYRYCLFDMTNIYVCLAGNGVVRLTLCHYAPMSYACTHT